MFHRGVIYGFHRGAGFFVVVVFICLFLFGSRWGGGLQAERIAKAGRGRGV